MLKGTNRPPEGFAFFRIFQCQVKSGLRCRHETNRRNQPFLRQKAGEISEAAIDFAQNIFLRYFYIVKEQLSRILCLQAHFIKFAPALKAFHAALNEEEAEAAP